jgi:hypothetical protein
VKSYVENAHSGIAANTNVARYCHSKTLLSWLASKEAVLIGRGTSNVNLARDLTFVLASTSRKLSHIGETSAVIKCLINEIYPLTNQIFEIREHSFIVSTAASDSDSGLKFTIREGDYQARLDRNGDWSHGYREAKADSSKVLCRGVSILVCNLDRYAGVVKPLPLV